MHHRVANFSLLLVLVLATCICSSCCAAQLQTISIDGAIAKPFTESAAELQTKFKASIRTISYTLKGHAHTAQAIPLIDVIQQAHPTYTKSIKNKKLRFVVEVTGRDGYTADFSLAELLPDIGGRDVWLAVSEDGKAIPGDNGPAAIISPDDKKPGRWVHGVAKITIIDTRRK